MRPSGAQGSSGRFGTAQITVSLAALLMIGLGASPYLRGPARPLSVTVARMSDPDNIGMVTRMTLHVTNIGITGGAPVVAVLSSFPFPVRWQVLAGSPRGSRAPAVYEVESPAAAALPLGEDFVVRVNDAGGHVFAVSRPMRASLDHPPAIVNPGFTKWILDPATDHPQPLGWEVLGLRSPLGPNLEVAESGVAGRRALVFHVTGGRRTPRGQGIRVQQSVSGDDRVADLMDHGFTVPVYPTFRTTPGYGPRSDTAGSVFGMQVYADGRFLWIVFSDADEGWYVQPRAAVFVLHAPLGRWSSHRVDLGAMYRRLGWARPGEMVFSLLVDAPGDPGMPNPAFGPITLEPAQPQ